MKQHYPAYRRLSIKDIREQDPLKQGLKLATCNLGTGGTIREQDPLKQGLKPDVWGNTNRTSRIREQDPLKQGLKL